MEDEISKIIYENSRLFKQRLDIMILSEKTSWQEKYSPVGWGLIGLARMTSHQILWRVKHGTSG